MMAPPSEPHWRGPSSQRLAGRPVREKCRTLFARRRGRMRQLVGTISVKPVGLCGYRTGDDGELAPKQSAAGGCTCTTAPGSPICMVLSRAEI